MRAAMVAALLFPLAANAQITWECRYSSFADGKSVRPLTEPFKLTFLLDQTNAYVVGNNGSSKVEHVVSGNGPTFIETTAFGNVMTTAITLKGDSVHSRATKTLAGELIASQYYGSCLRR